MQRIFLCYELGGFYMKRTNYLKWVSLFCLPFLFALAFRSQTCGAELTKEDYTPYSQKRVYVFYPGKSLNLETDIYYTEEQKQAIEKHYTSVESFLANVYDMEWAYKSKTTVDYMGLSKVKKKKVHHYFVEVDIVNKKHDFNKDFWVDYNVVVIKSNKKKVVFRPYYFENFMEEYVEDTRKEYKKKGTKKCGEAFYIRYPYKVKKANGKIQSDGFTVKYSCLIGKNKLETWDDQIWAEFQSGAKKRVALNRTKLVLKPQSTYKLKMTGTTAKTWKSSNPLVATVSAKGKVKALQAGTTTITCKGKNGKKYKCKIVVEETAYED